MRHFLLILAVLPVSAAITNVQVSGTTSTQVLISYDAPDSAACKINVSESPAFSPLVHDVDESLFPGSSSDLRLGSLSSGRQRVAVIGKHGMAANGGGNPFLAADGNRYSRALQANTLHYYQIQCGSAAYSGTFTTNTIPLGNTYPEPLALDSNNPGVYNWPTVTQPSSLAESFVDPNTGALIKKITKPTDSSNDVYNGWPTGGMMQMCSHLMAPANGHTYNLCSIPNSAFFTMVSIETDTGTVYPLTRLVVPYGVFGCQSGGPMNGVSFSSTDPMKIYFVSSCLATQYAGYRLYMGRWTGPLNVANQIGGAGLQSAMQLSLITPLGVGPLLAAYDPRYNSAQQAGLGGTSLVGAQNGILIFTALHAQDGIGWVFAVDPGNDQSIGSGGTGQVVAANPFWMAPVSRWCSSHTLTPAGDNNPWIQMISNSLGTKCIGDWCGPYYLTAGNNAGTGTTIQIAANGGSYEPFSDYTPSYLQNLAVGDQIHIGNAQDGEHAEVAAIDRVNHTVTLVRGNNLSQSLFVRGSNIIPIVDALVNVTAGTKLYMGCRAVSFSNRVGQNGGQWYWNYVNDPHGTSIAYPAANGTTSNQVVESYTYGGHQVTRDSVNIMDGWNRWDYANAVPGYDLVSFSIGTSYGSGHRPLNPDPAFAGVRPPGTIDTYQSHPSYDQMAASGREKEWLVDAMPLTNEGDARMYSATGALVSGATNTYKMTGGTGLHGKALTPIASCGAHPLADISSPTTGNAISDATPYTYCVANAANECQMGSSPGDVFVNCPGAQNLTCNTNAGGASVDICIGDSWAYANGAVQVSTTNTDPNGGGGRLISQLFATHHNENLYNNVHPTTDGKWLLFSTRNLTGTLEAYMAKLPPFPSQESTRRDTFIPVRLTLGAPAPPASGGTSPATRSRPLSSSAIVEFGYAENGDPGSFYCTSRRETCIAQDSSIDESRPFYFATTEAGSITGKACGSGCTIAIPALPGRVLYYRVTFRDSQGRLILQQRAAAQAVP